MHSISVQLPSSAGHTMAGTIDMPDTEPVAYALFAHCFTGSRFTPAAARVSKTLAEQSIACLRFDFPGLGQSTGDFHETCFSENVADIISAHQWLADNYRTPQLLIGHSLGGAHVEIQAYRFGHEGATFNGYGAIGMHGVKGSGNVTNYVKASDVVSAASRHYGRVVVLATEEDLEPLRRYGYNNQRNNYATRAFGAALSAVGSAHSSQNFVGKDSILSDRNYDRARRLADENRFMIQDFRGDVEFNRNILSAVFQAGELAVEVQKASAKSKITPKKPWDFKDRTTDTIQEQIKDIIKSVPTPKSLFDSRSLHLMQNDNMRPDVEKELYAGAGRPNISKPLTKNASADEFREYGFAALLADDDNKMHAALDSLLDSDIGRSLRQNADKVYAAQEREQEMVRLAEEQARQVDVPVMRMGRG